MAAAMSARRAPNFSIAAITASSTPPMAPFQPAWAAPITPASASANSTGAQSAVWMPSIRPGTLVAMPSPSGWRARPSRHPRHEPWRCESGPGLPTFRPATGQRWRGRDFFDPGGIVPAARSAIERGIDPIRHPAIASEKTMRDARQAGEVGGAVDREAHAGMMSLKSRRLCGRGRHKRHRLEQGAHLSNT